MEPWGLHAFVRRPFRNDAMNRGLWQFGMLVVAGLAACAPVAGAQTTADVRRTVYVTATTRAGAYVGDLTAADLRVREGGKLREIVDVRPSDVRLSVCLAIDEGLTPDLNVRESAIRFVQRLQPSVQVSLYLLGAGSVKLVDYTSDPAPLLKAINALPRRAQGGSNLVESLFQLTKQQRSLEGRRAIVLLATEVPERSTMTANGLLDELRDTGTVLHVSTLSGPAGTVAPPTPDMGHLETMDDVERDRALNDGAKQSGGLRLVAMRLDDVPSSLERIRGELLHEYVLTYLMPAGSKSDGRVSIETRRQGVTVRGPTQLPKL